MIHAQQWISTQVFTGHFGLHWLIDFDRGTTHCAPLSKANHARPQIAGARVPIFLTAMSLTSA
jgi:hypothetical protein